MNWQAMGQVVRSLWRSPGFSLTVIVSLALGLAANASVFALLNAILLRPLPYPRADELLHIGLGNGGVANLPVPATYYRAWMTASRSLTGSAEYRQVRATIGEGSDPEDVLGAAVSPSLADLLGVHPAKGRFLLPEDERPGEMTAVVLGHTLWVRQFGGDSLIVGRSIRLSDRSMTVVGVMPSGFDFPQHAEYWRPLPQATAGAMDYVTIVARSKPGLAIEAVRADLERIARPTDPELPRGIVDAAVTVLRLQDQLFGTARPALEMLMALAILLLVIECAGVANLVLARAASRRPEVALRLALGATRSAIVGPIIAESLLLAAIAGAVGTSLSFWTTHVFAVLGPPILMDAGSVKPDLRVLLFVSGLTFVTGALVGAGAALRATREEAFAVFAIKGNPTRTDRGFGLLRRFFAIVQIALAMLLLVDAGLLVKSFLRVTNAALGFEPGQVLVVSIRLPRSRYPDDASARQFFDDLGVVINSLPGVEQVAYGTPPLHGFELMQSPPDDGTGPLYSIATDAVGPRYFETYGIPILLGRGITADDNAAGAPVVVINNAAARLIFQDRAPIGEVISAMTVNGQHPEVVGVAADVPQYDPAIRALPEAFAPLSQVDGRPTEIAVRAQKNAEALTEPIRRTVRQVDSRLAVRIVVLDDVVRQSIAPRRFTALLAGAFAAFAVAVAAVGLFGLISYLATHRTHELGIRMALGAQRGDMIALVAREGVVLTGVGVAVGAIFALSLSNLLTNLIVGVQPRDPTILAVAGAFLVGIALLATLVPAWRAVRIDPITALRQD